MLTNNNKKIIKTLLDTLEMGNQKFLLVKQHFNKGLIQCLRGPLKPSIA